MRPFPLAFAAALGLHLSAAVVAQSHSVEHDALTFLDAQVFPKKAAACSARISGFSAQFDPAFRAWLASRRTRIAAGEAFLRADSEKTGTPVERDVQSIAASISQQWNEAPLSLLREHCDTLLGQLRESPEGE